MCWHHRILQTTAFKVEIRFKTPANTGFDILVIGTTPSGAEQTRISAEYKSYPPLSKFRGGIQDVLYYATEAAAGITHVYSYTLTPFGCCATQKNIKTGLTALGVTDFLTVHSTYNTDVRADPENAETILRDAGHIV